MIRSFLKVYRDHPVVQRFQALLILERFVTLNVFSRP
jgi:hypothetical protein